MHVVHIWTYGKRMVVLQMISQTVKNETRCLLYMNDLGNPLDTVVHYMHAWPLPATQMFILRPVRCSSLHAWD